MDYIWPCVVWYVVGMLCSLWWPIIYWHEYDYEDWMKVLWWMPVHGLFGPFAIATSFPI